MKGLEHPWKSRCGWGWAWIGCELDSKRETSHLAQCGKSLSSNMLQAKQWLNIFFFFFIPILIICFEKKILRPSPPESTAGIQGSVGRISMSASTELCQCTFVLANAFSSNPWPLQGRHYQVRRNWDTLLGGLELWIFACRKCYACLLLDPRQCFPWASRGRKWSEAQCD